MNKKGITGKAIGIIAIIVAIAIAVGVFKHPDITGLVIANNNGEVCDYYLQAYKDKGNEYIPINLAYRNDGDVDIGMWIWAKSDEVNFTKETYYDFLYADDKTSHYYEFEINKTSDLGDFVIEFIPYYKRFGSTRYAKHLVCKYKKKEKEEAWILEDGFFKEHS